MPDETLLGLRLVGPALPLPRTALDAIEARDGFHLPPSLRTLLETWGPGQLCGFTHLLDPTAEHNAWTFYREYFRGDALESRREYRLWAGVDDATWLRLAVFADLDGKVLAFDTGEPDRGGEFPVWYLDREGECAVRAGRTLAEVVERFLVGGAIDRVHPPAQRGRWECTETFVTRRPRGLEKQLLARLGDGDEDAAERVLAEMRAGVNGYEASAQLVDLLLGSEAERVAHALRAEWLERAVRWSERCAPGFAVKRGILRVVTALREGRAPGGLVPVNTDVDGACGALAIEVHPWDWVLGGVEWVVRNTGERASPACAVLVEPEGEAAEPMAGQRFELPALAPGAEHPMSAGWWLRVPTRVRIAVRPA